MNNSDLQDLLRSTLEEAERTAPPPTDLSERLVRTITLAGGTSRQRWIVHWVAPALVAAAVLAAVGATTVAIRSLHDSPTSPRPSTPATSAQPTPNFTTSTTSPAPTTARSVTPPNPAAPKSWAGLLEQIAGARHLPSSSFNNTAQGSARFGAVGFLTPSGNLGCWIDEGSQYQLVCRLKAFSFTPLDKPTCRSYEIADPHLVQLAYNTVLNPPCWAGVEPAFPYDTLPYGTAVGTGAYACVSQADGIGCANTKAGAGFWLSRTELRTFNSPAPPPTSPGVIWDCTAPPPQGQMAKAMPTSIVVTCADNGIGVQDLVWTSWTTTSASGSGRLWENNCAPSCALGTFGYYPASITLSGPVTTAKGVLFSRLSVNYTTTGPDGHTTDHFMLPLPPD